MVVMDKERTFKEDTYLTDGKTIIHIGYVSKIDWTPANNYGRKHTDYWNCSWYPYNGAYSGKTLISLHGNDIPGLWFQEGYHLDNFHEIDKNILSEKVLNTLAKQTI